METAKDVPESNEPHDTTGADPDGLEPVRVPEPDLETLGASVRRLMEQSRQQALQLDSLASSPADAPPAPFSFGAAGLAPGMPQQEAPAEPRPILELDGEEYEDELDTLTDWVDDFLMDAYGAEVTTAAPWCEQWQEHPDVVAWLHALWLAYQQHKDAEAGLTGMLLWHRDCLTHAMAHIRGPGGPLSACMTDPDRPAHRLLRGPRPSARASATDDTTDASDGHGRRGAPGEAGA